jgi:glutathionylspermidine synthase
MHRLLSRPRPDWEKKVESQGLIYHHTNGGLYWDETAYYQFSSREVDELEAATNELQRICLEAGQHIIDNKRFRDFGIPDAAVDAIVWSWNEEPPAIYGRFDLAYDGIQPPKLLEYNADTPTALLEAAVVQWYWLQDLHPKDDQFNSIHERLVAKWKELKDYCASPLYFAAVEDVQAEDLMTATYMRDTATEAGHQTEALLMKDIGWSAEDNAFADLQGNRIQSIFKLYPWEWMVHEDFGPHVLTTYRDVQWIEPIWKMLWSNKALLAVLWELYPNHPNLVPAYLDAPRDLTRYVKKPKLAREGANITYVGDEKIETPGDYGAEGFVYQALAPVPLVEGNYPVIGSWVVDGESAGMGIRESNTPITNNLSRFIPHLFKKE